MNTLNAKLLKKFLKLSAEKLTGEWVIVGGTVLPALGIEYRTTVDIDLVALHTADMSQSLKLMEILEQLELPIEAINQAATYFFFKTKHEKRDLIPLIEGAKCSVFRPSATLYLLLKIARMSESDLTDCREMVRYAKKLKEPINHARVRQAIEDLNQKEKNGEVRKRREQVLDWIE